VSKLGVEGPELGAERDFQKSQARPGLPWDEAEIESDFQEKCRKGAKLAARTAFWAILGEISCLFLLALEFFTRFRGGSFQPLTHLSGKQSLVFGRWPLVFGRWPLVFRRWLLAFDQRPRTNDQRPRTNDQRPTANNQRPTAKPTAGF
jgi:hypothetical protein